MIVYVGHYDGSGSRTGKYTFRRKSMEELKTALKNNIVGIPFQEFQIWEEEDGDNGEENPYPKKKG
jgi:hypothetical protein